MTQEALKLALEALELCNGAETVDGVVIYTDKEITAIKEALRENAMREVQRLGQEIEQEPVADAYTFAEMRFVVCPNCGNKRCPKANDHRNACTNSNEVGQKGSSWEHVKPLAQPEQEPVAYWKEHAQGLQRDYDSLLADFQAQQEERNFCQRCGKRTKDIHTCTPPQPYE